MNHHKSSESSRKIPQIYQKILVLRCVFFSPTALGRAAASASQDLDHQTEGAAALGGVGLASR